jgi:RNA polymerase sigma-70 factor (ECF subfamily)
MIFGALFGALWRAAPEPAAPLPGDANAERVKRALSGERRAFDELYSANVAGVSRLLARLVGTGADRDDLTQQAFLEAFRSLPRFRGDSAFATWLHRIAVNVAYQHLRRRKLTRWEEISDQLPTLAASPDHGARQQQELDRAVRYLSALKPRKRIAFVLRVVEELSLAEIGDLVGASSAAVGQRVKHAQRELAAMVERDRLRAPEEAR